MILAVVIHLSSYNIYSWILCVINKTCVTCSYKGTSYYVGSWQVWLKVVRFITTRRLLNKIGGRLWKWRTHDRQDVEPGVPAKQIWRHGCRRFRHLAMRGMNSLVWKRVLLAVVKTTETIGYDTTPRPVFVQLFPEAAFSVRIQGRDSEGLSKTLQLLKPLSQPS